MLPQVAIIFSSLIDLISDSHPAADFNRALACVNDDDAFRARLRAAQAGCIRAQFLVGLAYHTGRGVPVDYERAGAWYHRAAGSGDTYAIANLGLMSVLGQGGPADDLDAYAWIQSAVGLGHRRLNSVLEVLERRIMGVRESIPGVLSPEAPELRPCTQSICDYSRCI